MDYVFDQLSHLDVERTYRDIDNGGSYNAAVDALLGEYDYTVRLDGRRSHVTEKND